MQHNAATWNAEEARRDLEKINPDLMKLITDILKQGSDDAYRRVRDMYQQDFRALERDAHAQISRLEREIRVTQGELSALAEQMKQFQATDPSRQNLRVLFRELRSEWGAYTASEHKKRMDLKAELKRMIEEVAKVAQHADEVGWDNTKTITATHALVQQLQRSFAWPLGGPLDAGTLSKHIDDVEPRMTMNCSTCTRMCYRYRRDGDYPHRREYCSCGREFKP